MAQQVTAVAAWWRTIWSPHSLSSMAFGPRELWELCVESRCRSRSIFGAIGAGLQTLVGGNITLLTNLCEKTRQEALT